MNDMDLRQTIIDRCYACAVGYRNIGRDFSATIVLGFARDIEGGQPWQLYVSWLQDSEQRLAQFEGDMARGKAA